MSELIDGELALIDCELAHDAKLCSCEHPAAGHPRQVGVGLPRTLLDRHGSSHPLSRAAAIDKDLRSISTHRAEDRLSPTFTGSAATSATLPMSVSSVVVSHLMLRQNGPPSSELMPNTAAPSWSVLPVRGHVVAEKTRGFDANLAAHKVGPWLCRRTRYSATTPWP
jgi:hypothetical protein